MAIWIGRHVVRMLNIDPTGVSLTKRVNRTYSDVLIVAEWIEPSEASDESVRQTDRHCTVT